jgi:hypothetical protein
MIKENGLDVVDSFEVAKPSITFNLNAPNWITKLSKRLANQNTMPGINTLRMLPGVEKLLKDNDLYRKISTLPGLSATHFYFLWSKPRVPAAIVAGQGAAAAAPRAEA